MGIIITKKISCDCCGKQFKREMDYDKHMRYVGGYTLAILASRIEGEETDEEKLEHLIDHFGIAVRGGCNVHHALYDDEIYNCIILAMRSDDIIENINSETVSESEDSSWYTSHDDVADFIQNNKDKVKEAFNKMIQNKIKQEKKEFELSIEYLKERILKV
jgi:hypothetical protein